MRDKFDVFSEDIEIPDVVMQKAETAFRKIELESEGTLVNERIIESRFVNKRRKRIFRSQAAAAAAVCIILVGVGSAVAAVNHYWGRGMQGGIQASDEQQQILTNQGVASVLSESENYKDLAVTDAGITMTPETVIVDDKFAYVSFSVKGYTLGEDVEPGFDRVETYLGDDPKAEEGRVNMGGSFYDGILADENGAPSYEDGSPLEYSEDGDTKAHYVDEEGNLEYVIQVSVADAESSLLGKTLHVDFADLGTLHKTEFTGAVEGKWSFAIPLSGISSAKEIKAGKEVPGTDFVLDSIEVSPISIKLNYAVKGEVKASEDETGVPDFCGFVLKDGTRLPYAADGGMTGYTDETKTAAYVVSTYDRVIDPDQIAALLLRTEQGADMVEIALD